MSLEVISYNVQQARWKNRTRSIAAVLEMQADLYLMQEVDETVYDFLSDKLRGMKGRYQIVRWEHEAYVWMYSKTCIIHSQRFNLHSTRQIVFLKRLINVKNTPNSLWTTAGLFVDKEDGEYLRVASTHQTAQQLPSHRRKELLESLNLFDDSIAVIWAGDHNTVNKREVEGIGRILDEKWFEHFSHNIWWTCDWARLENRPRNMPLKIWGKVTGHSAPLDHARWNRQFTNRFALEQIQVLRTIKGENGESIKLTGSDHLPIQIKFSRK